MIASYREQLRCERVARATATGPIAVLPGDDHVVLLHLAAHDLGRQAVGHAGLNLDRTDEVTVLQPECALAFRRLGGAVGLLRRTRGILAALLVRWLAT